jgi:hypothetical protein
MPLCACGCGEECNRRFVPGHNWRNVRRKAVTNWRRKYLRNGQEFLVHRVRAERALGKPLPAGAIVHHADGSIDADAPLVICQDQSYHLLLHRRMRIVRAGGNPNTDKVCSRCRLAKPKTEFYQVTVVRMKTGDGYFNYCKDCTRIQNTKRKQGAA